MGNPIQPGREWDAPVGVALDMVQGAIKNTGGKVFGVMDVACTIVDVVKYPLYILLVQCPESLPVALGGPGQEILIFKLRHLVHLTGGVYIP